MTANVTIRTNNQPRLLLDWDQLTEREKAGFDYLSEDETVGRDFIRYKGRVYDLGDFMCTSKDSPFKDWDGYSSDSFFSGILVRYCKDDSDHVIMATYRS